MSWRADWFCEESDTEAPSGSPDVGTAVGAAAEAADGALVAAGADC